MPKNIEKNEVNELLAAAGGSYLDAYHLLVQRREEAVVKAERSTVAQRKQKLANDIEQVNQSRLMELHGKMSMAVEIIAINSQIALEQGQLLSEDEKVLLMRQFLDERDIVELLTVSKDRLRTLVFAHLTAEFEAQGAVDPDNQNGEILVPELGYRFVRERCGRNAAALNEEKLEGLLGDQWESVCDKEEIPAQLIPAHTRYVLREEKVLELAQRDSTVYDKLLDCLEVGGWKNPSFIVRPLKER